MAENPPANSVTFLLNFKTLLMPAARDQLRSLSFDQCHLSISPVSSLELLLAREHTVHGPTPPPIRDHYLLEFQGVKYP